MKECPCEYCKFQGENGCPRAAAEEEIDRLQKEIYRLEEEMSQQIEENRKEQSQEPN